MVCLQGHWEADLNTKVRRRVCVFIKSNMQEAKEHLP